MSVGFSGDNFPAPEEQIFIDNNVAPSLHSVDFAGGFDDTDEDGVTIGTHGNFHAKNNDMGGGANSNTMHFLIDYASNKAGLFSSAIHLPIAGRNISDFEAESFGRIGVEGFLNAKNSNTGANEVVHSYLGFLKSPIDPPNTINNHTNPIDSGELYAFYTPNGDTHLGNTLIDGVISNPEQGLAFTDDVRIAGELIISNDPEDPANKTLKVLDELEYSDPLILDARFGTTHNYAYANDSTLGPDKTFSVSVACPADSYVIGCSGFTEGTTTTAPYRGSYHWYKSNMNGGGCQARARKPSTNNVQLHVYAYCYAPHENIPSFESVIYE